MRAQQLYVVNIEEGWDMERALLYRLYKYYEEVRCDFYLRLERKEDLLAGDAACYRAGCLI